MERPEYLDRAWSAGETDGIMIDPTRFKVTAAAECGPSLILQPFPAGNEREAWAQWRAATAVGLAKADRTV